MHEKLARTLVEEELPTLDRPLRFVVVRGARGAVRGETLDELQERMELPYTDEEVARMRERPEREERGARHERRGPPARPGGRPGGGKRGGYGGRGGGRGRKRR